MKLGGREKLLIIAGGVVVALLLFYRLGLSPALERLRMLDRLVAVKERDLHQMKMLRETYVAQKRLMEDVNRTLAQRGQDFAIFSFLEDLASKAGMKDNIIYMKPALCGAGTAPADRASRAALHGREDARARNGRIQLALRRHWKGALSSRRGSTGGCRHASMARNGSI